MRLTLASRKSDLAKIQAYLVAEKLRQAWPELEIHHHFRESLGDKNLTDPLWQIPERGVFTEDFVMGLQNGEFDAVIHSWKDLPTHQRPGSEIVASLERADARDLLLLRPDLKAGQAWRILSSSPRRAHNLKDFFTDYLPVKPSAVEFVSVRGNVPRRIEKLSEGEGDGLIVAKAALDRLLDPKLEEFAPTRQKLRTWLTQFWIIVLPLELNPPAAAQGALAIEIRSDREDLKKIFAKIDHRTTRQNVEWERQQLSRFGGGCHLKIGLYREALANGAVLQIERGQSPQGVDFFKREMVMQNRPALAPQLCTEVLKNPAAAMLCPRSEDFFAIQTQTLDTKTQEQIFASHLRIAHVRAVSDSLKKNLQARGPRSPWIWTSGLDSWKKLVQQGLWVRGCDEGLGTLSGLSQNLGLLQPAHVPWLRLTHSDHADKNSSERSTVPTYQLLAKATDALPKSLQQARAFYWRSSALFRACVKIYPEIRDHDHACGPGATQAALENELGRPLTGRVFLNEIEWRSWCLEQARKST